MTGADDERRCWWGLFRDGRRLGPGDGVRLEPAADGGASLALDPGIPAGDLRLRVTSRKDPTRFAVVTVPVAPAAPDAGRPERRSQFVSRTPAGDSEKGDAPAAGGAWTEIAPPPALAAIPALESKDEPKHVPEPWVWRTRFTLTPAHVRQLWPSLARPSHPTLQGCAWDPGAAKPSIVAICQGSDRAYAVARLACDGTITPQASTDPKGVGARGPWRSTFVPQPVAIAVRARGQAVVADYGNRVVWEIAEGATPRIIAGVPRRSTGDDPLAGDLPADGSPRLATEIPLSFPSAISVDADDSVVFADYDQKRVYRITASGHLVTLTGDGGVPPGDSLPTARNDLDRPHPALTCNLGRPDGLALAPDGRILVLQEDGAPIALHRDGTFEHLEGLLHLGRTDSLPGAPGMGLAGSDAPWIRDLAVTTDNTIIWAPRQGYLEPHQRLAWIAGDGAPRELVGAGGREGSHSQPLAPAAAARFSPFIGPSLAPIPDGGTLVNTGTGIFLLGSGRGDAALAGLVQEAVAAAFNGRGHRHDAIVASLRAWVDHPRATDRATVMQAAFGKKGPLPPDPRALIGDFLRDPKAMAFRAQLALDAIAELTGWDGGRWTPAETKAPGGPPEREGLEPHA